MFSKNGADPGIKTLEKIHKLLKRAEKEFTRSIGVPVCVPNCGKCCEMNSISIRGVEARYLSLWLKKQKPEFQKEVLDACKRWLFEAFEKVGTKYGLGTVGMPPNVIDQLNQEVVWLAQKSGCPMLTEDKRCLIWPARPIVCQAYGITRVTPIDICQRPLGKIEEGPYRAYLRNETTDKIKDAIDQLKREIMETCYIQTSGFIASMILLEMEPQKFVEYAYHNDIASAKLVQLTGGYYMWQEQLQESYDRESEIQMIVNPMARPPMRIGKDGKPEEVIFEEGE